MKEVYLMTIHEFSKICKSTPRTIRLYEKMGLLHPIKVDPVTKYRYYSHLQTREFFKIKLLQTFHVPLKKINKMMTTGTKAFLEEKLKESNRIVTEKKKEQLFLKNIHSLLFQTEDVKNIMVRESVGPFTLFGGALTKESYDLIHDEALRIHSIAKKLRIKTEDKEMVFYLEKEKYKPKDTILEIMAVCKKIPNALKKLATQPVILNSPALSLSNPPVVLNLPALSLSNGIQDPLRIKPDSRSALPPGLFFKTFPKTPVYSYTYQGPHEFITLVYERLYELNILQELPVQFSPFDLHLSGPLTKKSSYDNVTKICFPIYNSKAELAS